MTKRGGEKKRGFSRERTSNQGTVIGKRGKKKKREGSERPHKGGRVPKVESLSTKKKGGKKGEPFLLVGIHFVPP